MNLCPISPLTITITVASVLSHFIDTTGSEYTCDEQLVGKPMAFFYTLKQTSHDCNIPRHSEEVNSITDFETS